MKNKEKELEIFTFDQIKDEFIGEVGTVKRSLYEQDLQMEAKLMDFSALKAKVNFNVVLMKGEFKIA